MASGSRKKAQARKKLLKGDGVFQFAGENAPSVPWVKKAEADALAETRVADTDTVRTEGQADSQWVSTTVSTTPATSPLEKSGMENGLIWPDVFDFSPWSGILGAARARAATTSTAAQTVQRTAKSVHVKSRNINEPRSRNAGADQAGNASEATNWGQSASEHLDNSSPTSDKKH